MPEAWDIIKPPFWACFFSWTDLKEKGHNDFLDALKIDLSWVMKFKLHCRLYTKGFVLFSPPLLILLLSIFFIFPYFKFFYNTNNPEFCLACILNEPCSCQKKWLVLIKYLKATQTRTQDPTEEEQTSLLHLSALMEMLSSANSKMRWSNRQTLGTWSLQCHETSLRSNRK